MECKKTINELSSYLDGELDTALKHTLESHLTYCNHCHAVYDSTKKTIELYCDGKLFELPVEVRTRLHEVLKRKCQECK
ncbi:MAG TPA: zf-HC2 domain-containing protein [Terriglobia bacterium]|nr:zf-HC2 domain-containing protein [Terriglobia bacterium]